MSQSYAPFNRQSPFQQGHRTNDSTESYLTGVFPRSNMTQSMADVIRSRAQGKIIISPQQNTMYSTAVPQRQKQLTGNKSLSGLQQWISPPLTLFQSPKGPIFKDGHRMKSPKIESYDQTRRNSNLRPMDKVDHHREKVKQALAQRKFAYTTEDITSSSQPMMSSYLYAIKKVSQNLFNKDESSRHGRLQQSRLMQSNQIERPNNNKSPHTTTAPQFYANQSLVQSNYKHQSQSGSLIDDLQVNASYMVASKQDHHFTSQASTKFTDDRYKEDYKDITYPRQNPQHTTKSVTYQDDETKNYLHQQQQQQNVHMQKQNVIETTQIQNKKTFVQQQTFGLSDSLQVDSESFEQSSGGNIKSPPNLKQEKREAFNLHKQTSDVVVHSPPPMILRSHNKGGNVQSSEISTPKAQENPQKFMDQKVQSPPTPKAKEHFSRNVEQKVQSPKKQSDDIFMEEMEDLDDIEIEQHKITKDHVKKIGQNMLNPPSQQPTEKPKLDSPNMLNMFRTYIKKYNKYLQQINVVGDMVANAIELLEANKNVWIIPLFLIFKRMSQLRQKIDHDLDSNLNPWKLASFDMFRKCPEYETFKTTLTNENEIVQKELSEIMAVARKKMAKLDKNGAQKMEPMINLNMDVDIKDTVFVYLYSQIYARAKQNVKSTSEKFSQRQNVLLLLKIQSSLIILEMPLYDDLGDRFNKNEYDEILKEQDVAKITLYSTKLEIIVNLLKLRLKTQGYQL